MGEYETLIPGITGDTLLCYEKLSVLAEHYNQNGQGHGLLDFLGKNVQTRAEYFEAAEAFRRRVLLDFVNAGVDFSSFDGVVISPFAKIGAGTVIHASTQIKSGVCIGENCEIGPMSIIEDSRVGNHCVLLATQVCCSVIENNVKIGPFCNIRPNCRIESGVKIGDFVEVKNSTVGKDTHASHLTYIGDSDVGARVNFGCGVVTVNFNGKTKGRTVIGDDVFVGCNSNLVAPVTIEDNAYIAAGSTITDNVPVSALGIARSRQTNIPEWVIKNKDRIKK